MPHLSPRFEVALTYATVLHAGQVRKGTEIPYISHPLIVAGIALENGADEDAAIAALLHDTAEDAGGLPRLADIRSRFGERVAHIVAACTDTYENPKPRWRTRKEQYIAHLREETDAGVLLVSASDKLANARAIVNDYTRLGEPLFDRFNGGREGTLWYYRSLSDVFTARGVPLAGELEGVVATLERLSGAGG